MESFAYGIGILIGFQLMLGFMFGIYLAPSIIAASTVSRGTFCRPAM